MAVNVNVGAADNNNPPVISGSIAPTFTDGTGATYSLAQFVTDADPDVLTYSISAGTLPASVTLNENTGLLTFSGSGIAATTAGLQFSVFDGTETTQSDAFSVIVNVVVSNWQLPVGNFPTSEFDMVIVNPRPDTETVSSEKHRLHPSGIRLEYPVKVFGGAAPHRYDITAGPAGLSVGNQDGDVDYNVVYWETPTIGTHSVTVRVRDQEFGRNTSGFTNEASLTTQLVVRDREDTDYFIWVDPAASGGGDGSYTSPLQTVAQAQALNLNNKQLWFKSGTHDLTATNSHDWFGAFDGHFIGNNGPTVANRATCWSGIPGQTTSLNFVSAQLGFDGDGAGIYDIDLVGSGYASSIGNFRYIYVATCDRFGLYKVDVPNAVIGTSADDNNTLLFAGQFNYQRQYAWLDRCSDLNRPASSNSSNLFVLYGVDYIVEEHSNCDGSASSGPNPKHDCRYIARRYGTYASAKHIGHGGGSNRLGCGPGEMVFNYIKNYSRWDDNGSFNATFGPFFIKRNTINGFAEVLDSDDANKGPYTFDANAITGGVDTGTRIVSINTECNSAGAIDGAGNLQGTFTQYIGTHGHVRSS